MTNKENNNVSENQKKQQFQDAEISQEVLQGVVQQDMPNEFSATKQKKSKMPFIIIAIIVVVFIAASIAVFLYGISQKSKNDEILFKNGLLNVCVDDKWGYINQKGEYVIDPKFDDAEAFYDGMAEVEIDGKVGYISEKGDYIINPQFDSIGYFSEDVAYAKSGNIYGYINKKGEYIINPQFDDVSKFQEGLAAVKSGDKWGYIDKKGKYVINPQFDEAAVFSNGLAAVKSGGQCGYINKKGEYKINPQYLIAYSFESDGYAIVLNKNKKYEIINKDGKSMGTPFDKVETKKSSICIESDCTEMAFYDDDTHCYEHKTNTTSTYKYCQAYGCLNKVYLSYKKYCSQHSYLE